MLMEFMVPLVTLCCSMVLCIACIDLLCQFHQIYEATSSKLAGEKWLLGQCDDPHFFSKMHLHSDICFTVENNARIGAFMLSLREFTQSLLGSDFLLGGRVGAWGLLARIGSWPFLVCVGLLLLLGPSWLVSGSRAFYVRRHWPVCQDACFKDA